MPITAWICRGCRGLEVPLDHFATTSCGESVCHPDYAAAVLADRGSQRQGVVRVSHGVGCPRRAGIEQTEDYAVDPLDLLAAMSGSAWHLLMEHAAPPGEAEVPVTIDVEGIRVTGKSDRPRRLPDGRLAIGDWKVKGDYQFNKKDAPDTEHIVQLSMYAHGMKADLLELWYKGHSAFKPMQAPVMPMDQALAHRPFEGNFTVRELYQQADDLMAGRKTWRDLPLAGQSMKFGPTKTACSYCSVRETCTIGAFGAPF